MLVIAALSGRALAQAGAAGRFATTVIDLFGDRETRRAARMWRCVGGDISRGLDAADFERVLDEYDTDWPLIYGGGLEGQWDLLARINHQRPILGNRPDVIAQLKNPGIFFTTLERLGLPFLTTRRTRPKQSAHWLRKRSGSTGGFGVGPCLPAASSQDLDSRTDYYYQRRGTGVPYSVQFIAEGARVDILCFCRQDPAPGPGMPYRFGAIATWNHAAPHPDRNLKGTMVERLVAATQSLSQTFSLRGLNSLDVLIDGDSFVILEINPRPGAGIDLLESIAPGWCMAAHIAASQSRAWPQWPGMEGKYAHWQIIYAGDDLWLPEKVVWPSYCLDTPPGMRKIAAREPVCSILTQSDSPEGGEILSLARAATLRRQLAHYKRAA